MIGAKSSSWLSFLSMKTYLIAAAIVALLAPVAEFKRACRTRFQVSSIQQRDSTPAYVELGQVLGRPRRRQFANACCLYVACSIVLTLAVLSEKRCPKTISKCLNMRGIAVDDSLESEVRSGRKGSTLDEPREARARTKVGRRESTRLQPV